MNRLLTIVPRKFRRRTEIRRNEFALARMPEYLLKDIGVTRSEIGRRYRQAG
ncbi:DUF1127 domain-containing protein [Roseibium salinum]|uniref:DUF1127 domain-containing protein n=1 Tax=Roseibium salinum TaxID=1604349 RepID=A0ABT3QY01_9HYPH|nr:DUF1127 domain-containing protein [Roseibium sp. DSM 29163]MCX2721799.1 DUF1127 domain-containing protein [Roseibium sp. DSM 29163]MDN3720164.1 DUF1127 domain-containing protein [Roseibium salinum]